MQRPPESWKTIPTLTPADNHAVNLSIIPRDKKRARSTVSKFPSPKSPGNCVWVTTNWTWCSVSQGILQAPASSHWVLSSCFLTQGCVGPLPSTVRCVEAPRPHRLTHTERSLRVQALGHSIPRKVCLHQHTLQKCLLLRAPAQECSSKGPCGPEAHPDRWIPARGP